MILRLDGFPEPGVPVVFQPIFVAVGAVFTLLTFVAMRRFSGQRVIMSFSTLLLLSLMMYPGTLTHYNVLLIVPVLGLLGVFDSKVGAHLVAGLVTLVLVLVSFSHWLPNLLAVSMLWGAYFGYSILCPQLVEE